MTQNQSAQHVRLYTEVCVCIKHRLYQKVEPGFAVFLFPVLMLWANNLPTKSPKNSTSLILSRGSSTPPVQPVARQLPCRVTPPPAEEWLISCSRLYHHLRQVRAFFSICRPSHPGRVIQATEPFADAFLPGPVCLADCAKWLSIMCVQGRDGETHKDRFIILGPDCVQRGPKVWDRFPIKEKDASRMLFMGPPPPPPLPVPNGWS